MCAQFANSLVIRQVFCQIIFLVGRVGRRAPATERNQAGCLVNLAKMDKLTREIHLTAAEKAKVARWVDTNCQYYGSYWGRRNIKYKKHPNYRIDVTFDQVLAPISPTPEKER